MIDSIEQTAEWAILKFSGIVTTEDMIAARKAVIDVPEFKTRKYHIWLFNSVSDLQLDAIKMERLSYEDKINFSLNSDLKVALVADTEIAYGMSRMYQGMINQLWNAQVFRCFDAAFDWCNRP